MAEAFYGQQDIFDDSSDFNTRDFHIRQRNAQLRTGVAVKVIAVHPGINGAAPTIDVQPLVNQVDGQGNQTPHGIIYGIPVSRNQGGGNAIINDPVVGDIGSMIAHDRDISALKNNQGAQSNPGSFRTHDLADGVYHGAILNPANPNQAVQFTATGVKIFDKNGTIIETSSAGVKITGNLMVTGEVTAGFGGGDSVALQTHIHSGVSPGGGNTAAPVAGT